MNLLQRGAVLFGFAFVGFGISACSGGGPNVPALYPTAVPSGVATTTPTTAPSGTATTTPTTAPTGTATTTPTTAPTGTATTAPTTTPTTAPTGTATTAPTTSPTSVATTAPTTAPTTAAACPPASPYPSPASTTIPFSTNTGTIQLPTYQDITGNSQIPMITSGLPATVTLMMGRTNFDNAPNPGNGTPIIYSSLLLNSSSGSVTFNTNMIPVSLTSPCSVTAGHTYNLYGYAAGSQIQATTGITPSGNTVSTNLVIPALYGDSFPSGVTVDLVITQS